MIFIDTPATKEMVVAVESLLARCVEVVVRDHHDAIDPRNQREKEIAAAASRVRELIGDKARISDRKTHPACSSLIRVGEFNGEGTVLVADPDPDGLTASMKAVGIYYAKLDSDAAVLDGGRAGQTAEALSEEAFLFVRAMATLPTFDAKRPDVSETAKAKLFTDFVAVIQGDKEARLRLQAGVEVYEAGVQNALAIAAKAHELCPGVVSVNVESETKYNLGILTTALEAYPGCRITVLRKDSGPIASVHGGIQYSLAVAKPFQAEINLQTFLPEGFESSPESGIISNTSFLLHLNEQNWENVCIALHRQFTKEKTCDRCGYTGQWLPYLQGDSWPRCQSCGTN